MEIIKNCICVGLGGMFGAVSRYLMTLIPIKQRTELPLITLTTNVIGAFLIGWIIAVIGKESGMNPYWVLILKVGFCGGFTTFSTFSLETTQLLANGKYMTGMFYILFSVALCVTAVWGAGALVK